MHVARWIAYSYSSDAHILHILKKSRSSLLLCVELLNVLRIQRSEQKGKERFVSPKSKRGQSLLYFVGGSHTAGHQAEKCEAYYFAPFNALLFQPFVSLHWNFAPIRRSSIDCRVLFDSRAQILLV